MRLALLLLTFTSLSSGSHYPSVDSNHAKEEPARCGFKDIVHLEGAQTSDSANPSSPDLQNVLEQFQMAITDKDSLAFQALFFQPKVAFVGIMSPTTEASIKKDYPEFQGIAVSNSGKFIQEIIKTTQPQREDFFNPSFKINGVLASVSFDYSYYSGDQMMQWGHEKWNLVLVDNEWLITDVIYSVHFPDVEECPFE